MYVCGCIVLNFINTRHVFNHFFFFFFFFCPLCSLIDSDEYVKKNVATLIREIAKHTPEVKKQNYMCQNYYVPSVAREGICILKMSVSFLNFSHLNYTPEVPTCTVKKKTQRDSSTMPYIMGLVLVRLSPPSVCFCSLNIGGGCVVGV